VNQLSEVLLSLALGGGILAGIANFFAVVDMCSPHLKSNTAKTEIANRTLTDAVLVQIITFVLQIAVVCLALILNTRKNKTLDAIAISLAITLPVCWIWCWTLLFRSIACDTSFLGKKYLLFYLPFVIGIVVAIVLSIFHW
jgi:hypothetical protein